MGTTTPTTAKASQVLESINQNLKYIETSIVNGTYKQQETILKLMLKDTVEAVKKLDFTFRVPFTNDKNKQHFSTYINRALKMKATLLTNLEEIHAELFTKHGNSKRALTLVQKMINTKLYKNVVAGYIGRWKNATNFPIKNEIIYTT